MILLLLVLLVATPARAAITLFVTAKLPTSENGALAGPTITVAPPASMASDDLVTVLVCYRGLSVTITTSTTGGQTWSNATEVESTTEACNLFWAKFNGTWGA